MEPAYDTGELRASLTETTADIFGKMDEQTGRPLPNLILDEAQGDAPGTHQRGVGGVLGPYVEAPRERAAHPPKVGHRR